MSKYLFIMIRHTLKLVFRNFSRHKSSFLINLGGLSTGLACALLIFLWVNDELKVDRFHEKENRLFQVMEHQEYAEGIFTVRSTPGLLAETLAEEVPEVENAVTIMWPDRFTLTVGAQNIKGKAQYVGGDFFNIFSFPLLEGTPKGVLQDPNSVVLSRTMAESLFDSAGAAVGKTVELDHEQVFTVSGVFEDVPVHSSLQFDFLLPFEKYKRENEWILNWQSNSPQTVVTLVEGAEMEAVSDKIAGFVKKRVEDSNVTLFLQPFAERYLHGQYKAGQLVGGRIEYVRLFSIIAVFILLIACINFMNLSTARASRRAREVGIKKAVGAGQTALVRQFLGESLLISFLSLAVALLLVQLFLPSFNAITEKEVGHWFSAGLLAAFLGITVVTGLLAGSYPALYLSSFRPVKVLKGELRTSLGELWVRRGLVVFQFSLSVVLIVAVLVVYRQMQYVQSKNLGYEKDHLIYFPMDGRLAEQGDVFLAETAKLPGVTSVSTTAHDLLGRQNNTSGLEWDGKDPNDRILFEHVRVNYGLLETIGVELKEGRSFSRAYGSDTTKVIFNETAVEIMGMEDPVGQRITLWEEYELEIIGVVKDFHFQSLHEGMKPLFFRLAPDENWIVMARLDAAREQEAIAGLQAFYEKFNPGFSFDFLFVDEQYARQYAAERRVSTLSRYFAGFAVLISCLGLFGLAAFTADRKKKEIGIRKVLGASVANIVLLLTRDFTRLVLAAILIGLPVAWYLSYNWLDRFAYRIELNGWFFLLAGLTVLLIAWVTVSSQAFRSARVNPTDCLRDE